MNETTALSSAMAASYNMTAVLQRATSVQGVSDEARSCGDAIDAVLSNVTSQVWAARMLDATAKLPEPLGGGLRTHLGDFDGCLDVGGRYCLAALELPGPTTAPPFPAVLRVAMCVPSVCAQGSLDELLRSATGNRMGVPHGDCQAADDPPRALTATFVLGCVMGLSLALALASCLATRLASWERCPLSPAARTVAASLSPVAAWTSLATPAAPNAQGPLSSLAGLRVVTIAWVVFGHRVMMQASLPLLDLKELPVRLISWQYTFIPAGLFAVDTFLTLAGIVLAFSFIRRPPTNFGPSKLATFYLHRYIRLTPLLAFVVLLYAGALPVLGRGPLWPQQENLQSAPCRSNWWPTLIYIHNYYKNRNMCVGHAWYLAVDMHLYLLSPLLLLPLVHRPRVGAMMLIGAIVAAVIIPFTIVMVDGLSPIPNPFGDFNAYLAHTEGVYIPTHARASPWLVGVALGAWMGRKRSLAVTARVAVALWTLVAVALLLPTAASTFLLRQGDKAIPSWESAAFVALSKPLWAMGVCAVVLLCGAGRGGLVAGVLSWGPFTVLARLTYAVYLLHPLVQATTSWPTRGPTVAEDFVVWPMSVSDLALSFVVALPTSLLFESPFIALERHLLKPSSKGGPSPPAPEGPAVPLHAQQPSSPQPSPQADIALDVEATPEEPRSTGVVVPSAGTCTIQVYSVPQGLVTPETSSPPS